MRFGAVGIAVADSPGMGLAMTLRFRWPFYWEKKQGDEPEGDWVPAASCHDSDCDAPIHFGTTWKQNKIEKLTPKEERVL